MKSVEGYNVLLKVGNKTFAGTTSDSLSISADIKESIFKSDQGNRRYSVVGHTYSADVSGAIQVTDGGQTPTTEEIDPMTLAMLKGSEAQLQITYIAANGKTYNGVAVISSYKEDSPSDDITTFSLSLNITSLEPQS